MRKRICIVGSGSWATALVKLFSDSGVHTNWLVRDATLATDILTYGQNPRYLSSVKIDLTLVKPTVDAKLACDGSALILFAVPSTFLPEAVKLFAAEMVEDIPMAAAIKGLVPGTGMVPSRFIARHYGKEAQGVLVLGGPCHAEEIAAQRTTYLTIAGHDRELVEFIHGQINCHYIRAVMSDDPAGVEYAAILKNIIGIASGISKGLLYGDNFQSVLVSNAMREASAFMNAVEPASRDMFRSAYFGDLLVTAYSDYSRNQTLGRLVGRGLQVNLAIREMEMVAEGFNASRELAETIKKFNVQMPVVTAVHRILHLHSNPFREFKILEEQFN